MIRQTSIEAYHKIRKDGLLSMRRWETYDALYRCGPKTAAELACLMPGYKSQSVGANVHARLCELREMGIGNLFAPGTNTADIAQYIKDWVSERQK